MDRLQTMAVFVAVAEESGFAPAARRLKMSSPSVTRAVAELEDRLDARLLHRTTRAVHLTEAGERYLADCRRILSEVEEADQHAAGIHGAPKGSVSLTAPSVFGRIIITPILFDLLNLYPDITVKTMFVDRMVHMIDEGIDVAVRIASLPDSSLTAIRVGEVRRVLCASPDYLTLHGRPRTPLDLAAHRIAAFVTMTPGGEWRFEKDGKSETFKPDSRLLVNSVDEAISAAVAGQGLARVLSYQNRAQIETGQLETVLADYEPPAVPVHIVHKEAGQTSARVRATVDHLVAALRKHPALT